MHAKLSIYIQNILFPAKKNQDKLHGYKLYLSNGKENNEPKSNAISAQNTSCIETGFMKYFKPIAAWIKTWIMFHSRGKIRCVLQWSLHCFSSRML